MRVLLVNDYAPGTGWGTEIYLERLAAGLTAAGDEVELFAGEISHRGARKALDLWDPFARRALVRAARRFRPDVVHHHNVVRELSVSVLGAPRGVPAVLTVHDLRLLGLHELTSGRLRNVANMTRARFELAVARRRVDVAMALSHEIAGRLMAAGFRSVVRVPGFAGSEPSVPGVVPVAASTDLVFAGRLRRDKGPDVIIEAFARVAAAHPSARLVLAGDGPERSRLEVAAARLPAGRVVLPGSVSEDEVRTLMARARAVVAPSIPRLRPEGAGLTVIEAALLGRPVVVSDDPALREFVDRSGGGIVVAAGSAADLAVALDRILSDAGEAERMGEAARAFAEAEHTPGRVIPVIRHTYRTAVEAARRPDRSAGHAPDRPGARSPGA